MLYNVVFVSAVQRSESAIVSISCSVMSYSLQPYGLWPARLLCPWDSPGKSIGVGSHSLPQGIFLTQRLNLALQHCRQIVYCLSHQGSPNQLYVYIDPLSLGLFLPHRVHLGPHRELSWVPCAIQHVPASYLVYTCGARRSIPVSQCTPTPPLAYVCSLRLRL